MSIRANTPRVRNPRVAISATGRQGQRPSADRPATHRTEALMEPSPPTGPPATEAAEAADVMDVIEEERRRLRQAHSVMVCARFTLDYIDFVEDEWGLDVADVVEVACGLVREALANLDCATLSRSNERTDSVSRPRGGRKASARQRLATG